MMQRREFITLLGGANIFIAAGAAGAQQGDRVRRIGVLLSSTADDPVFQTWVGAFLQGLAQSDWIIGRNVQIETRWAGFKADDIRRHAQELVALVPDVILAHGASTVGSLLQLTRSIPIVFPVITDLVGAGYVESLARPGRNATGFMVNEYSLNAKDLELLKDIAPGITVSTSAGESPFFVAQASWLDGSHQHRIGWKFKTFEGAVRLCSIYTRVFRRQVAYHEAGHAVIAWLLGFTGVWIDMEDGPYRAVTRHDFLPALLPLAAVMLSPATCMRI
jgi:hypothetical protein